VSVPVSSIETAGAFLDGMGAGFISSGSGRELCLFA
jgi:hypothetical protein